MPRLESLQDLLVQELHDIYNAENQITKALPKMAKAATSPELQRAFQEHLQQTEGQIKRLEQAFNLMGEPVKGKRCEGMAGIIEEGKETLEEDAEDSVRDAALIAAAQKVEHYEIASYGCVATYADMLGLDDVAQLLRATLGEEEETDQHLSDLAESVINAEAAAGGTDVNSSRRTAAARRSGTESGGEGARPTRSGRARRARHPIEKD